MTKQEIDAEELKKHREPCTADDNEFRVCSVAFEEASKNHELYELKVTRDAGVQGDILKLKPEDTTSIKAYNGGHKEVSGNEKSENDGTRG